MSTNIGRALAISLVCALVAGSLIGLLFAGIPTLKGQSAQSERYRLEKDEKGRLFRLDTSTGEVVQVDQLRGESKQPSAPTPKKVNVVVSSPRIEPPPQPPAPDEPLVRTPDVPEPEPEPVAVAVAMAAKSACGASVDASQQLVVSASSTEVFIRPARTHARVASLPSGVRADVMEVAGDWYLVRFKDDRWGQRAGYVHCDDVQAAETDLN